MVEESKSNLGKKAYNNGKITKLINIGDEIPEGFVPGRLKLSKEALESRNKKNRDKLNNMTEEEKRERFEKKSKAMKKAWAKVSEEDRHELAMKIVANGGGWNKGTIHNTVQERYGVDNVSSLDDVKELKKETLKEISQEKWGVDNPFQAEENRVKLKEAIREKYKVEYIGSNSEVIKKKENTCLERYGRTYGFDFDKCKDTIMNKYGVLYSCLLPQCMDSIGAKGKHTKPNEEFAKILDDNNIAYEREFIIGKKSYDFKIGNILIEIDPFPTHNSTWSLFNKSQGIDRNYHYLKSKLAEENGYRCIHIFDWDDKAKIISILKKREKVNARECEIREVDLDIARDYINEYHLQGYAKDKIRIGLYKGKELVSIMTFDKPRYNKNYEYELVRYCANKYVVGGAEKLFKYFLNKYNPKNIISYCDYSKFNGNLYTNLGMKCIKNTICKHWYNPKTKEHYTDAYVNKLGYDKIFNANYGKGSSNKELMKEHKFVEIYDAGQKVYILDSI